MGPPATNQNSFLIRTALVLLAVAVIGAGYLLANALIHGPILGCGEGSGCDRVLKSRFAYLLPGLPVTAPALIVYLILIVCLSKPGNRLASDTRQFLSLVCAGLIVGAAALFLGIQAIKLKQFCPYCVATHIAGSIGATFAVFGLGLINRRALSQLVGAGFTVGVSLAAMIACQYFFPQQTYVSAEAGTDANKAGGKALTIGEATINLEDTPFRGNINSGKLVVLLFDYTCGACRTAHRYLRRAEEHFGVGSLLIVGIPVPLNPNCNPAFTDRSPQHADACDHARLALALWKIDREAYKKWDYWMFEAGTANSAPSPAEALAKAESLADPKELKSMLAEPWIDKQISRNVEIWKSNTIRLNRMSMPQVIMGTRIFAGAPGSEVALFDLMRENLSLPPVNPSLGGAGTKGKD